MGYTGLIEKPKHRAVGLAAPVTTFAILAASCASNSISNTLPGAGGGEEEGSTGAGSHAQVADTVLKPIPTRFLFKKIGTKKCCVGAGQTTGCSNTCTDSNGLLTSAGFDKADDYYRASGQWALDTFDKWKAEYNFPRRRPDESLDGFRVRTKHVVYYNRTELGLGRELACAANGTKI